MHDAMCEELHPKDGSHGESAYGVRIGSDCVGTEQDADSSCTVNKQNDSSDGACNSPKEKMKEG